jgi:ubiquinone/menaquinone biosynthesis C-methylase UbiE
MLRYDGERLIPGDHRLKNLLIEDLAKFRFASQYAINKLVLDAGCGAGQGSAYLSRSGARYVVGIDVSSEAIVYARRTFPQNNLTFVVMDALYLGFPDHTFDLVTSIEVIEHLSEPDRYVAEIRRVLRDRGILVLSTPNKLISSPTPGTIWPHHVKEFYPDELYTLLTKHFSSVEMWGMWIPVYDQHPARRLMHWLAPLFKPILPRMLRIRALPTLQRLIKADLSLEDISISRADIARKPTLIAICYA